MKRNRDYAWLLYAIIIAIAVLVSSCGVTPQPVNLDALSLAGVSIKDSIQFELDAEQVVQLDIPEETPITGDTVCAYIVDSIMYIQHYMVNKIPGYKYQKKMFRFIWNN